MAGYESESHVSGVAVAGIGDVPLVTSLQELLDVFCVGP